jgi:hypothetical protein
MLETLTHWDGCSQPRVKRCIQGRQILAHLALLLGGVVGTDALADAQLVVGHGKVTSVANEPDGNDLSVLGGTRQAHIDTLAQWHLGLVGAVGMEGKGAIVLPGEGVGAVKQASALQDQKELAVLTAGIAKHVGNPLAHALGHDVEWKVGTGTVALAVGGAAKHARSQKVPAAQDTLPGQIVEMPAFKVRT